MQLDFHYQHDKVEKRLQQMKFRRLHKRDYLQKDVDEYKKNITQLKELLDMGTLVNLPVQSEI